MICNELGRDRRPSITEAIDTTIPAKPLHDAQTGGFSVSGFDYTFGLEPASHDCQKLGITLSSFRVHIATATPG